MITILAILCLTSEILALIGLARGGRPDFFTRLMAGAWIVSALCLSLAVLVGA